MKPENPLLDFQVSASTIRFPRFIESLAKPGRGSVPAARFAFLHSKVDDQEIRKNKKKIY